MSDDLTKKLMSSTDAMLWAEAFMDIFGDRREDIDVGLMVGWFANAIETAKRDARGPSVPLVEDLAPGVVEGLAALTDNYGPRGVALALAALYPGAIPSEVPA